MSVTCAGLEDKPLQILIMNKSILRCLDYLCLRNRSHSIYTLWYRLDMIDLAPKMESKIGWGGSENLLSHLHWLFAQTLAIRLPFSGLVKWGLQNW